MSDRTAQLPQDSIALRQEVIDTCLWLVKTGLTFSTWGNVSLRLADGNILITPSRVEYDKMRPEDMVVIAPDGHIVDGFRLPTSERELHRGILNRRPDIQAIVHTHSPKAMACCALPGGIPAITEEMCQLLAGAIPITPRFVASEKHLELGETVTDALGDTAYAVLIRNHGPVCCGRSLSEARTACQVVEKSAGIYLDVLGHQPMVIEDQWVKAGRLYFTDAYGKT